MNQVYFGEVIRLVNAILTIANRFHLNFKDAVDRVEGALEGLISAQPNKSSDLRTVARSLLRARSRRAEILGVGLFRDPAWDILLDLYANTRQGGSLMISSLCHAAGVPPTTALRYVHKLVDAGVLLCEDHPHDQRRTMVRLAPHTAERIEQLLTTINGG